MTLGQNLNDYIDSRTNENTVGSYITNSSNKKEKKLLIY